MLALAGWARYLRGYDLNGRKIRIDDPEADLLTKLANMAGNNPDPLLRHEILADLRLVPGFSERLGEMVASIDEHGVIATLRQSLQDDSRELVAR